MREKGATVQRLALGAALLVALGWNLAHAAEVQGVRVSAGATGTRADIALDGAADFHLIRLHDPERLAVDLPGSHLARGASLPGGTGVVQNVRSGAPAAGTLRLVFDLSQPIAALQPRIERGEGPARLVIEWPGDAPVTIPRTDSEVTAQTSTLDTAPGSAGIGATSAGNPVSGSDVISRPASPPLATVVSQDLGAARVPPATPAVVPQTPIRNPANTAGIADPIAKPTVVGRLEDAGVAPVSGNSALSAPVAGGATAATLPAGARIATGVPTHIATGKPAPVVDRAVPAVPKRIGTVRTLIVAIDAGHGGQDPGASGLNGSREKDVTLAIARELARQVNATPGLKAYLTRDTDVFIPLPRRTQLARQAHADIFVSIHADAAENRAAKGSSVYVLSLKGASSQRARWLADKENAADLMGGVRLAQASSTLASVLLDLTQSGQMRASEDAAGHVLTGLKQIGYNHKPNIERANFAVLRTSDMPAMLVETAFISNPEEEQRLNTPEHRRALARAVLDGVNTYFTRQPPPGTLYAARADAGGAAGM